MSCVALYEAKNTLTDIVRQVETGEPIELTRHGKPVAILVGINRFREMEQTARTFSLAFRQYRTDWQDDLAAEAAETGAVYADAFASIRDAGTGRKVEL